MILFATDYRPLFTGLLLPVVPRMTRDLYKATGRSTRLLDAQGRAMTETGVRLAAMPEHERPDRVIFVSITDGGENDSQEYHRFHGGWQRVAEMRKHQEEKYSWSFTIIGQDYDPGEYAQQTGISARNAVRTSKAQTSEMYENLTKGMLNYRMGCAGPQGPSGCRGATGSNVQDFASAMDDKRSLQEIVAQQPDPAASV